MQIRKLIERRIRHAGRGINVDSDVNAVVAANVGEQGAATHVSSTQHSVADSKSSEQERAETD